MHSLGKAAQKENVAPVQGICRSAIFHGAVRDRRWLLLPLLLPSRPTVRGHVLFSPAVVEDVGDVEVRRAGFPGFRLKKQGFLFGGGGSFHLF